jgi:hypothetical protein
MQLAKEQIAQYAAEIIDMVDDDIHGGAIPADVTSFVDLHSYVDANCYLIDAEIPWGADIADESDPDGCMPCNQVSDEVSRLLTARNLERLDDAECGCPVYVRVGVQHIEACERNQHGRGGVPQLGVEPDARTPFAEAVLVAEVRYDKELQHAVDHVGDLGWLFDMAGDPARWATLGADDGSGEDKVRARLLRYAEWLTRVAERLPS